MSTGDAVIFLDSDDVLEPSIAREVAPFWRAGISKIQVQMRRVDARGRPIGSIFPTYRVPPTPQQIRHWMRTTASYPTPPGSGNVYARSFLEQLFPLDNRCGDATDSACLAAAPILGDVVSVVKPLVRYRIHGHNRSDLLSDSSRFTQQIERAYQRHQFAVELSGHEPSRANCIGPLFKGRHLLQMRIAEHKMCGGSPPIPTDSSSRMLFDSFRNLTVPGPETVITRLLGSLWCVATLLAPAKAAERMVRWRFGRM